MDNQEKDFYDLLEKLNSLYAYVKWEETTAIKEHTDIFGVKIESTETYFKREISTDFRDAMRLSRSSMENLITCLFQHNGDLIGLTDHVIETEKAKSDKQPVKPRDTVRKNKNHRLSEVLKLIE